MSDGIELTDDEYDTFMAVLAEQRCQHSHTDTACPPPPERAILTDLIAEVRAAYAVNRALDAADRAETRLRTLQTPGGPVGADLTKGEGFGDE